MALELSMDVHVPEADTNGLRRRSVDVVTSQEDGTRALDDEPLLARTTELGRLLVTQDDDLLTIAAEWQNADRPFVGIAYPHQMGPSIGQMIADLELLYDCAELAELANLVTYLPLT